jgi:hypothetical protein
MDPKKHQTVERWSRLQKDREGLKWEIIGEKNRGRETAVE